MIWIRDHEFHAAEGITRPRILAQSIRKIVGTDCRPVDCQRIDTSYPTCPVTEELQMLPGEVAGIPANQWQLIFNSDGWWNIPMEVED